MDAMIQSESVSFFLWLKRHDNKLRSYAPDQTARLAVACGFKLPMACSLISDRLAHIRRLMDFWESPLSAQWLRLVRHESGND